VARSVTKHDFEVLSNLIFDSYLTREVELYGCHFVLRTLTTEERDQISREYKRLSSKYNMRLIIEVLERAIVYVNGYKFDRFRNGYLVGLLKSSLVFELYKEYQKMNEVINESSRFIDYYVETRDSRNLWLVFKTCSRIAEPFSIRKLNQYQYYWIVLNCIKDYSESEKREWMKVEYSTNSICAFVNPKAYRKSKDKMGIVEQLDKDEDGVRREVELLEKGEKTVEVESNDVFSSLARMANESTDEHEARVNILMEKTLKGEIVDEHDRLVRNNEIETFKKFLREKRKQVLVEREVFKRRGIKFDSTEALENESLRVQMEEDRKKGFFHDEFSYLEIVRMKDFAAVSKIEKEKAFDEVMSENIEIDNEVNIFLKDLSSGKESLVDEEQNKDNQPPVTMDNYVDDVLEALSDSSNNVEVDSNKSVAQMAASMDVSVEGVDLMKQRRMKMKRINDAMSARGSVKSEKKVIEPDLDVMRFE